MKCDEMRFILHHHPPYGSLIPSIVVTVLGSREQKSHQN